MRHASSTGDGASADITAAHSASVACLVRLAATFLGNPIILLATQQAGGPDELISIGIEGEILPSSSAFCGVPCAPFEPQLVTDARADPDLRCDPMVTEAPKIRSCLIVPIGGEGSQIIGRLCALSPRLGAFDVEALAHMGELAKFIERLLECQPARAFPLGHGPEGGDNLEFVTRAQAAAEMGAWEIDLAQRAVAFSQHAGTLHGFDGSVRLSLRQALRCYQPSSHRSFRAAIKNAIQHQTVISVEANLVHHNNIGRRVRLIGSAVTGSHGKVCVSGIVFDCTTDHQREIAQQNAAQRDCLTGLYNRAAFDQHLGEALVTATRRPFHVALLDLDGFKEVNDTLGHAVGDHVLVAIAERLSKKSKSLTNVARWGGDEFVLLFSSQISTDEAFQFITQLIGELNNFNVTGSGSLSLGASCGLVKVDQTISIDEVMRRVDLALYDAKASGRGRISIWNSGLEAALSAKKDCIIQLQAALDQTLTFPVYQPMVDLRDGKFIGVEALLRIGGQNGLVIAAQQIHSALLDRQLAHAVSKTMLADIAADGEQLLDLLGVDCEIAINISEADLRTPELGQRLLAVIKNSVLAPANLAIEVSESVIVRDHTGAACKALQKIHDLGFAVSLDDFGTGICSLTQLRDFPISKVKIDQGLVARLAFDHQARLMITAIVQMSHSLDLKVVAEGVETAEQEAFLRGIGCDMAQGFWFGRPSTIANFGANLKKASQRQAASYIKSTRGQRGQ